MHQGVMSDVVEEVWPLAVGTVKANVCWLGPRCKLLHTSSPFSLPVELGTCPDM